MPDPSDRRRRLDAGPPAAAKVQTLSPRVKRAIGLFATTAAKTRREASTLAGCHPIYLGQLMTHNPLAQAEFARVAKHLDAATADIGAVMHQLSVKALGVIEETMLDASSEQLRFKAAQDLADRGPQTSKVQRHQVDNFTVDPSTAKELASAMVAAARVRQAFSHIAIGSHDATGVSTPQLTPPVDGSRPTGPG